MMSQIAFLQAQLRDVHTAQPIPNLNVNPSAPSTMPGATPLSSAASDSQEMPNVIVSSSAAVFKNSVKMKVPSIYNSSQKVNAAEM